MDPYTQAMFQQMQSQIQQMGLQVAALAQQNEALKVGNLEGVGPPEQINWPMQFKAGTIKFPHKEPHPFWESVIVTPTGDAEFGETAAEAQGVFVVDRNSPSFLVGLDASMYQYEEAEQAENVVLNRFRPLASHQFCSPSSSGCESLMDFEFAIFYGNDDQLAQKNWLPSTMLVSDRSVGPAFVFPVEKEITDYENVLIKARPLQEAGADNKFRLRFIPWIYKMLPKRKA